MCNENNNDAKTAPVEEEAEDGGWGWVVVGAAFVTNLIADGVTFTFGVLFVDLLRHFGEGKSHTASVGGLFMAMPLLVGPVAGAMADRFGCRVICMVGAVIAAAGLALSAWARSLDALLLSFGVLAGAGLALCYVAAVVCVALHFSRRRAFATGLAVCGSGLGTFLFAPLSARLLESLGWRGTALALAALFLHIAVCGALMRPPALPKPERETDINSWSPINLQQVALSNKVNEASQARPFHSLLNIPTFVGAGDRLLPPEVAARIREQEPLSPSMVHRHSLTYRGAVINFHCAQQRATSCPDISHRPEQTNECSNKWRSCLQDVGSVLAAMFDMSHFSDARFTLFSISNFLLYSWYEVPYVFLTDKAVEMGFNENDSSLIISTLGLLNMVGMVILGWLGDRPKVNAITIYAMCMFLCGLSTAIVPLITNYWGLCLVAAVFGFSISANYTLASIILVQLVSLERFTNSYGLLLLVQGLASLIGPPLAGWLYDVSDSYDLSFYLAGFFIILSGVLLVVLPVWQWLRHKHILSKVDMDSPYL